MLEKKQIELIPISEKDTEYILKLRNTLEISKYFFSQLPVYDFEHKLWLYDLDKVLDFIIFYNSKKVGRIYIYNIDFLNEKGEFGIVLEKNYSGKGIAFKASKLLLNYVFKNLKINKINLEVLSDNTKAINLYKKIGFKQEGYFKEEIYKNGEFKDVIRMAYHKSEWKNENSI
jgi:diamine N-acetyltransferase